MTPARKSKGVITVITPAKPPRVVTNELELERRLAALENMILAFTENREDGEKQREIEAG